MEAKRRPGIIKLALDSNRLFSTDGGRVPCTVVVSASLSAMSGKSPKATQALDIEEKAITSTLKATEYRILELFMLLAACGQKKRRAVSH
jgi:hypothetical protein